MNNYEFEITRLVRCEIVSGRKLTSIKRKCELTGPEMNFQASELRRDLVIVTNFRPLDIQSLGMEISTSKAGRRIKRLYY